jgi:hypothetical protein
MTLTALTASAVLLTGAKLPAGSDPNFESYFTSAQTFTTSEPHRAMAMLELLLVPQSTTFSVALGELPESLRPRFTEGIRRGFGLWEDALGSDFPFKLSFDERRDADIELRIVDKIGDEKDQMGELFVTRRVSWSKHSHIGQLNGTMKIVRFAQPGRHLSVDEVTHIVAHELGHAFGLGDVDDVRQIMGPVLIGRPYARLTRDEVRRVLQIRDGIREEYRTAMESSR